MSKVGDIPRSPAPLWVFGLGGLIAEALMMAAIVRLSGIAQWILLAAAVVFLFGLFGFFGYVLITKAWVFYPPSEYPNGNSPAEFIAALAVGHPSANDLPPALAVGTEDVLQTEDSSMPSDILEAASIPGATTLETPPGTFGEARMALIVAGIRKKDIVAAQEAFDTAMTLNLDIAQVNDLRVLFEQLRYFNGATDALARLQEMASLEETAVLANEALAVLAETTDDYDLARGHYSAAASAEATESKRAGYVVSQYKAGYKGSGDPALAAELAQRASSFSDPAIRSSVLAGAADIYKSARQFDLQAITLDEALGLVPNDSGMLFGCAYAYSQAGFPMLAMLHYKQLLTFEANRMARNNLGVALKELELPVLAVKAYRTAFDSGNTLSAANLASMLINAGFIEEADKILEEAEADDEPHENVVHTRASLTDAFESETKKEEKLESRALLMRGFLRRFSAARRAAPSVPGPSGLWLVPQVGMVDVRVEDGLLSCDSLAHRAADSTDRFMAVPQPMTGDTVKLRIRRGFWNSAGWAADASSQHYAYYDPARDVVEVMNVTPSAEAEFRTWTRVEQTADPETSD